MEPENPQPIFRHAVTVYQASGMVSVQADCSCHDAIELIEARAAANGQTVDDVAQAVVERRIRFGDSPRESTSDRAASV